MGDFSSIAAKILQEKAGKSALGLDRLQQGTSSASLKSHESVSTKPAGFFVSINGNVESGDFYGLANVYIRYQFHYGPDWEIMNGIDFGVSQLAQHPSGGCGDLGLLWNFPIDLTFKSTNPFGWPRIVITAYRVDFLGRDIILGYGSTHMPTFPGCHRRQISMFAPSASSPSLLSTLYSLWTGQKPEFYDSAFIAQGENRNVTRVESTGVVKLNLNVLTRGMSDHGYSRGKSYEDQY